MDLRNYVTMRLISVYFYPASQQVEYLRVISIPCDLFEILKNARARSNQQCSLYWALVSQIVGTQASGHLN